jgi:hypothetical protein
MADNGLPDPALFAQVGEVAASGSVAERRAFLRRAAMIGLPALLVSVRARTAWAQAQGPSCAASLGTSGCAQRNGLDQPIDQPLAQTIDQGGGGRGRGR